MIWAVFRFEPMGTWTQLQVWWAKPEKCSDQPKIINHKPNVHTFPSGNTRYIFEYIFQHNCCLGVRIQLNNNNHSLHAFRPLSYIYDLRILIVYLVDSCLLVFMIWHPLINLSFLFLFIQNGIEYVKSNFLRSISFCRPVRYINYTYGYYSLNHNILYHSQFE